MSVALIVRLRAEHDIAEAGLWYETRRPGTALHFIRCVDATMSLLARSPKMGPAQFEPFRRILIPRFPFGIFYTVTEEAVIVHGIFHNSRDPEKIRGLLKESDY